MLNMEIKNNLKNGLKIYIMILYHGTNYETWLTHIKEEGIKSMSEHLVSLSTKPEYAEAYAKKKYNDIIILEVEIDKEYLEQITNTSYRTKYVPVKNIKRICPNYTGFRKYQDIDF